MAQASRKLSRGEKKLFLVTGVAVVLILGLGGWRSYVNAIPELVIPTRQLPSPNAYDFYIKAGNAIIPAKPAVDPIDDVVKIPESQWKKRYPTAAKEAWLRRNAPALNLLRRGFKYPCSVPPQRSANLSKLKNYRVFFATARMLVIESHAFGERGNWGKAGESALDVIRLGHDIAQDGMLMDSLTSAAVNSTGRSAAWEVILHLSATEAKTATRRLEKINNTRVSYADILREDKYFGQATLHKQLRSGDLQSFGVSNGDGIEQLKGLWQAFKTPRRVVFNNYVNYIDAVISEAGKPYDPKSPSSRQAGNIFSDLLSPVYGQGRVTCARDEVGQELLLLSLALRAYHLEKNRYPGTLNELVPRYLKRIPNDAFGAGEPLRYKVLGKKYSLYSVGPDGIDNQGRAIEDKSKSGHARYFVKPESKGDFVAGINM